MKVVINGCYGGFGISSKATKELAIRKAKCIDFDKPIDYYGGNNEKYPRPDWIDRFNKDLAEKYTEDLGDGYFGERGWDSVYDSKNILILSCKHRTDEGVRTDKDFIEIVEKMGREASGMCASLHVVEVPDDVEWEIDEYDGIESIHEVHRSWG